MRTPRRPPLDVVAAPARPDVVVATPYVPDWGSVDSAPEGMAVPRSPWVAPLALGTMAVASVAVIEWNHALVSVYTAAIRALAGSGHHLQPHSLGFRPFFAFVIGVLSVASPGSLSARLRVAAASLGWYLLAVLAFDVVLLVGRPLGAPYPFSFAGDVGAALIGVVILTRSLYRWRAMPEAVAVARARPSSSGRSIRMLVVIGLTAVLVGLLTQLGGTELQTLRTYAILGGLGPGVVLALPVLSVMLFGLSVATRATSPRRDAECGPGPTSFAFLVPAYNEAKVIADCVASIDSAARESGVACRIYVVDNLSEDATARIADMAIDRCEALTGRVLSCRTPGKSHALNAGLAEIGEEITVRVDADTVVSPSLILQLRSHFCDPSVAVVGGLTLPRHNDTLLDRMRAIEVYENAGFKRVAQAGVDSILVVPGIMAAYRTDVARDLGGFGHGFNGEDADIVIRAGRAGFRIVQDPEIIVFSEVPRTMGHLREQRLRWSRSLFHVAARNAPAMRVGQGPRGFFYIPIMVFYGARRPLVPTILVFGTAVFATGSSVVDVRHGAAVVAMLVGANMLVSVFTLMVYRQFRLLAYLPAYLGFRAFRAYIALEALLTLPIARRVRQSAPRAEVEAAQI